MTDLFNRRCLLACLATAAFCGVAAAAPADLDRSLGGTGKVVTSISSGHDFFESVAIQSDGKIVAGGSSHNGTHNESALTRYHADGRLDTSFNGTGTVLAGAGNFDAYGNSVAVQSDGRILIAGKDLIRYNPNGTLDTSFNGTGTAVRALSAAHAVTVQSDGKIIIAGGGYSLDIKLARYHPDGTFDTNFNGTGTVTTSYRFDSDHARDVAVQPDGKIVVGGTTGDFPNTSMIVLRYNSDGSLDSTFGGGGIVTPFLAASRSGGNGLALQSDGKILVAGGAYNGSSNDFALVRCNTNGSPDTSFGSTGYVKTSFGAGNDFAYRVVVQSNGRIVVVGESANDGGYDIAMARYNPNGTVDTTFNGTGRLKTLIGGAGYARGLGVALRSDGRILVAGISSNGNDYDSALVGYQGDDSQTLAPTLASPASSTITKAPISVDLTLPEAALPGSVKLSFGGIELTLDGTLEAAGPHTFTFDPANPVATSGGAIDAINGGSSIADGTHTVTLRYQDAAGNLESSATSTNVKVDTVAQMPTLTSVSSVAYQNRRMSLSFTLPEAATPGTVKLIFSGVDTPQEFVLVSAFATSGPHGLSFDPDAPMASGHFTSATALADSTYAVTLSYQDEPGNAVAISWAVSGVSVASASAPGTVDTLNASIGGGFGAWAIAEQPDGKLIIGGDFTSVLGVPRNGVARLNADGTLDMGFDPNVDRTVSCLAVQADGKVLLGGFFHTIQPNGATVSTPRSRLARVNADGTLDESFDPNPNNFIVCLTVQPDGKVLLGGALTTLQPNGAPSSTNRRSIARVNADGTLDMGFDPKASGTVESVVVQPDGKVLLGGAFVTLQPNGAASPTLRRRVARVNADGTLDAAFDPNANDAVFAVILQADGKVLLGGRFTGLQPNGAVTSTARLRIARLNADGTVDSSFDPGADGSVSSVALAADGKVLLGGEFRSLQPNGAASSTPRSRLARVNADGTLDLDFDPNPQGSVLSVALQEDGKILIGGGFDVVEPKPAGPLAQRNGFARLLNGPAPQTLAVPSPSQVRWNRNGATTEVSAVMFEWSTDGGSTWTPAGSGTREGVTANWTLTNLTLPDSGQLRVRGRTAGNGNGSSGLIEQIAAFSFLPTATTPTFGAVTASSATLGGNVTGDGGLAISERGIVYAAKIANADPVIDGLDAVKVVADGTMGVFTAAVSGLAPHTAYTFKAYATNAADTGYTSAATFTTLNTLPTAPDGNTTGTTGDQKNVTVNFPTTDADGDAVTITGATAVTGLTVNGFTGTTVTFTPLASLVGDASFTYTVNDGFDAATGTITVAVTDNDAPVIDAHADVNVLAPSLGGVVVNYAATATDNVTANPTITYSKDPGTVFPLGTTTVTINSIDAATNAATPVIFTVTVHLQGPANTSILMQGEDAPGRLTAADLPDDAVIASFGVPATDDDGNLAFLATWTSNNGRVKGRGLFTQTTCLGVVGGVVPGGNATFRTFADPVIHGGNVACLATISGARKVVLFGPAAGPLAVLAQSGTVAPDADGATFKKFSNVGVAGSNVGFMAALDATAASDVGLWLKAGAQPLGLVLREGSDPLTNRLKTIVAFKAGNGSPGAGRGWVRQSGAPWMLALVTHTDRTVPPAVLQAGPGGVGKLNNDTTATGETFASFGLPAANARDDVAFLAKLAVGGAVTKANASGIFANAAGGPFNTIARVSDDAVQGAKFSLLKDPVLANDGGLAFPATIKGGTVKGVAMQTLWWKPFGQPLALLAQGGSDAGDLPGAKWKAFTSLAIAGRGRGPIFAATLVPKKGGVLATSAAGVWACDFNGDPRLLFRTGVPDAIIPGKTLKSFTLLKASVGSEGVTRSFNDNAQVVWLATFTDKTTAIITTQVP